MCDPRCRYQPAIDAVAFIAIAIRDRQPVE
jgi:hypothetical protein